MASADGNDDYKQSGEDLAEMGRQDNALTKRLVFISGVALLLVFIIAAVIIALITAGDGADKQKIDRVTPLTIQVAAPAAKAASSFVVRLP